MDCSSDDKRKAKVELVCDRKSSLAHEGDLTNLYLDLTSRDISRNQCGDVNDDVVVHAPSAVL